MPNPSRTTRILSKAVFCCSTGHFCNHYRLRRLRWRRRNDDDRIFNVAVYRWYFHDPNLDGYGKLNLGDDGDGINDHKLDRYHNLDLDWKDHDGNDRDDNRINDVDGNHNRHIHDGDRDWWNEHHDNYRHDGNNGNNRHNRHNRHDNRHNDLNRWQHRKLPAERDRVQFWRSARRNR